MSCADVPTSENIFFKKYIYITHFLEYSASLFMFIHILAIGLFHWMPRVSRVPNGIC